MKKLITLDIIIFLLIILLIYAATSKILDYETFKAQIGKSPLIMHYTDTIAWLVPASEYLSVIMLLFPRLTLAGLYGSFFLMLSFTAYIFFILTFSPYVPCSCGGILNKLGWTEHLIFNITFTLLAFTGILLQIRRDKKESIHQTSFQ